MNETDPRQPAVPQTGLDTGADAATAERPGEAARPIPWSIRELWLAAALPGGILALFSVVLSAAGDILQWSKAELEASSIVLGPSLVFAGWLLFVRGRGTGWRDLGLRAFRPGGSLFVPMLLVVDFIFVVAYIGLLDMYAALPSTKPSGTLPWGWSTAFSSHLSVRSSSTEQCSSAGSGTTSAREGPRSSLRRSSPSITSIPCSSYLTSSVASCWRPSSTPPDRSGRLSCSTPLGTHGSKWVRQVSGSWR